MYGKPAMTWKSKRKACMVILVKESSNVKQLPLNLVCKIWLKRQKRKDVKTDENGRR
jgi:hypothetical protein